MQVTDIFSLFSLTEGYTCIEGSDCGYNPGWCRSHPTVSEMT